MEDDTHADTCAVGNGFYVEDYLERHCDVNAFLGSYKERRVPIVNGCYAFDAPDGRSYLIVINQALYFEGEDVSLLSTFQARAAGVVVDNCPRQFSEKSTFAITFPDSDISVPFQL